MLDELGTGEYLLIAVGPAQAGEEVHQGLRQVPLIAILEDRGRAVAFREARSILSQDQRQVGKLWKRRVERLVEQDLARAVRDVIVPAQDVRDPHVDVVDHDAEIVDGCAVRALDDEVVEGRVLEDDGALHEMVDRGRAGGRRRETEGEGRATGGGSGRAPAGPVVGGTPSRRERRLTTRVDLLRGAPAAICPALLEQPPAVLGIQGIALRLEERALVPVEAEPGEAVEILGYRRLRRALAIGVLEARDEAPGVVACEQPVEQRGARAPDVQVTGGTRRKAGADLHWRDLTGRILDVKFPASGGADAGLSPARAACILEGRPAALRGRRSRR